VSFLWHYPSARAGLAFDEQGVGYLTNSHRLYSFDVAAQQTTLIGRHEATSMSGLAFAKGQTVFVSESGTSKAFPVVLDAQPASDVVIRLSLENTEESTVDKQLLVFTPDNWNTPQIVTVTGVDDQIIDGVETTLVRLSVDALASDDPFDALADQIIRVVTVDDDIPIFTFDDVSVNESAGTARLSIGLNKPFEEDVRIVLRRFEETATIGSDYIMPLQQGLILEAGSISIATDVAIVADEIVEGDETFMVRLEVFDFDDERVIDTPLFATVTIVDIDAATIGIQGSGDIDESDPVGGVLTLTQTQISENDVMVHYTITGTAVPGTDHAATSDTITIEARQTTAMISIPLLDDNLVEANETVIVTLDSVVVTSNADVSIDPTATSHSFLILDNDVSELVVVETDDDTTVLESGSTDSFSVALNIKPDSNVMVVVNSKIGRAHV